MKAWQGSAAVSDHHGVVSPDYLVMEFTSRWAVKPRFYHYLLRSTPLKSEYAKRAYGIRPSQWRLMYEDFRDIPLLLPPLEDQTRVASFLDRKTAAIDALIAKKRRLVELLAEKRAALINQAVTKGLDPTVPMRDSGIPWIGEIPAHWNLRPLGYSVSLRGGSTPSKEEPSFWGGDIPWVSPKDMKVFEIGDSLDHVTNDALRRTSLKTIPVGATLVVVRGMILARTLPVAITTSPVTINQDMKALVPSGHLHPEFLAWQLRSRVAEAMTLIEEAGHGTKTFRTDLFTKLMLLVPSREEQYGIIAHLKRRVTEIEQAESKIHDSLALLQERRQALISAAVTGQLQIPVTEPKESWSRVLAENPKLASKGSP